MPLQSGRFAVEPLQDRHDRARFESGVVELDRYLRVQAGQDARRKVAAPFVLSDRNRMVVGYYTLSAYGIQLADLPPDIIGKLPRYPVLPATLLGRLAISREFQGLKLGQFLLMDALHRSLENTHQIGSTGVYVEASDEKAEAFYRHHQFTPLPGVSKKLFLRMTTIKKLLQEIN